MIKELPQLTLVAICGNKHSETLASLYRSLQQIKPTKVKLITNINIEANGIEVINVGGLQTWEAYNYFCIKELNKYFDTDFVLVTQWDSWVLDSAQWDDDYFNIDYIGAKWFAHEKPYIIANGGFSIRSKKLQKILAEDDFIKITAPEDNTIGKFYRSYLEQKYGIKYADEKLADKFSFELNMPVQKTFGFHGWHHEPFKETVVIKRSYALGDVIMCEPVMEYFYNKGYRVAFDSGQHNQDLFFSHYFPVYDKNILPKNLSYREINLDGAYEAQPSKNHLESYYDFAGVPKEERIMRNPKLSLVAPAIGLNKLFKKYCVLHIDIRPEEYRNIHGIDWNKVVKYLNKKGYTVIQVGNYKHETVRGAIEINTPTIPFLMWLVAGSDLFCGIDSGISHIASAFDIPSIIFTGSVDLRKIHPDLSNKLWINNNDKKVCERQMCWHYSISTYGTECYIDNKMPPCSIFDTDETIEKINKFINSKKK